MTNNFITMTIWPIKITGSVGSGRGQDKLCYCFFIWLHSEVIFIYLFIYSLQFYDNNQLTNAI